MSEPKKLTPEEIKESMLNNTNKTILNWLRHIIDTDTAVERIKESIDKMNEHLEEE